MFSVSNEVLLLFVRVAKIRGKTHIPVYTHAPTKNKPKRAKLNWASFASPQIIPLEYDRCIFVVLRRSSFSIEWKFQSSYLLFRGA